MSDTRVGSFPDQDSADLAESKGRESLFQLRAESERLEKVEESETADEERYLREFFMA